MQNGSQRRIRVSTDDFPDEKRLAMWRELYGRGITQVDIEPLSDAFRADVTFNLLPNVSIAAGSRSPAHYRVTRELLKDARVQIEDKIWRAYGTLRHSRVISSQEVVNLSSAVRFGVALAIPGLASVRTLNEVLIRTQPAHVQLAAGKELEQRERNVLRAELVRALLDANEPDAVNPN